MKKLKLKSNVDVFLDAFELQDENAFVEKNTDLTSKLIKDYILGSITKSELVEKIYNAQDNEKEALLAVILALETINRTQRDIEEGIKKLEKAAVNMLTQTDFSVN